SRSRSCRSVGTMHINVTSPVSQPETWRCTKPASIDATPNAFIHGAARLIRPRWRSHGIPYMVHYAVPECCGSSYSGSFRLLHLAPPTSARLALPRIEGWLSIAMFLRGFVIAIRSGHIGGAG
ncbi:hypothetical protein MCOR12_011806, partial [Pyricularia oryzae]